MFGVFCILIAGDNLNIRSDRYNLLACDVTDDGLQAVLEEAGLKNDSPTFLLAECVLIYIEADKSSKLIKWAANYFDTSMFVIYEMIHPNDAFGQVMITNLNVNLNVSLILEQRMCYIKY